MRYRMEITPAMKPGKRHKIQAALTALGYRVIGGGTTTDMTCCDISFELRKPMKLKPDPETKRLVKKKK